MGIQVLRNNKLRFWGPFPKVGLGPSQALGPSTKFGLQAFQKTPARTHYYVSSPRKYFENMIKFGLRYSKFWNLFTYQGTPIMLAVARIWWLPGRSTRTMVKLCKKSLDFTVSLKLLSPEEKPKTLLYCWKIYSLDQFWAATLLLELYNKNKLYSECPDLHKKCKWRGVMMGGL